MTLLNLIHVLHKSNKLVLCTAIPLVTVFCIKFIACTISQKHEIDKQLEQELQSDKNYLKIGDVFISVQNQGRSPKTKIPMVYCNM